MLVKQKQEMEKIYSDINTVSCDKNIAKRMLSDFAYGIFFNDY